jgi:hypothetical protein
MIYLAEEGETRLPESVSLREVRPTVGATVSLLGLEGMIPWEAADTGFVVEVPEGIRDNPPGAYAWVFRISAVEGRDPAN